jgi:hypothetical protein
MSEYVIDCTGDCCRGDEVEFERAVFTGSFRKPRFSHNETVRGTIVKESYGIKTGQHTFTILKTDGEKLLIKGRNLYRNRVMRKPWENEDSRLSVLEEKHKRGAVARSWHSM